MNVKHRLRSLWEWMLHFGAYPDESAEQRGKRRILVAVLWIATTLTTLATFGGLEEGGAWSVGINSVGILLLPVFLAGISWKPRWFGPLAHVFLAYVLFQGMLKAVLTGGLFESGLESVFGLAVVLLVLILFGIRTALAWFGVFIVSFIVVSILPNWIDPVYELADPEGTAAFNLIALSFINIAAMVYFVRQRDRFQQESDDLLHNILPDEIALRLKSDTSMIADDYESASVLFADVVNFTPMSATLTPAELVGLLNNVFTTFDRFVDELGLEKIKTVGDEYMVASGVPRIRPDHAHAIAELALQMRDYCAKHRFDGHDITLRIGINSGPVVAGVVGTHKFAYDLWGDVVNTASRMESEGIAGHIQISDSTYQLIKNDFVCEARGEIQVKGKGSMHTWLLNAPTPRTTRRETIASAFEADAPGA